MTAATNKLIQPSPALTLAMRRRPFSPHLLIVYLAFSTILPLSSPFISHATPVSNTSTVKDLRGDVSTPWLDILETRIVQVGPERIQFDAILKGPPTSSPSEWASYYWYFDTDFNKETGEKRESVGAEYILLIHYEDGQWSAILWQTYQGSFYSEAPFFLDGNTVSACIVKSMLGGASQFRWEMETFKPNSYDYAGPAEFEFSTDLAEEKDYDIEPKALHLLHGEAEGVITVEASGGEAAPEDVKFFASAPGLLGDQNSGAVKVEPGMFGLFKVTVKIDGVVCATWVDVKVGSAELTPPILLLSLTGATSGVLTVKAYDAFDSEIPVNELEFVSSNPSGASVDDSGTVTALMLPTGYNDLSYISATVNGVSVENQAVIRVTRDDSGITLSEQREACVSFYFPEQVIQGIDYPKLFNEWDVPRLTEITYTASEEMFGYSPFHGEIQYLVHEPCHSADEEMVAGLSGNPIQLMIDLDKPSWFTSFVGHLSVILHELGHNFFDNTPPGSIFLSEEKLGDADYDVASIHEAYTECVAEVFRLYTMKMMERRPNEYGVTEEQLAIMRPYLKEQDTTPDFDSYVEEGAEYNAITSRILVDITHTIYTRYGYDNLYGFLSIFKASNDLTRFNVDSVEKQATFFVASISSSVGVDLRDRFRNWGFPVDDAYYTGIIEDVEKIVGENWAVTQSDERASSSITLTEPDQFTVGSPVELSGAVIPNVNGLPLRLEYLDEGWKPIANITSGYGGSFKFVWGESPARVGGLTVRVSFPGDSFHREASAEAEYTVSKIASSISLQLDAATPNVGQPTAIGGRLSPALSNAEVNMRYTYPDGSFIQHQIRTGEDGVFTDSFTPSVSGNINVAASFAGDSTHGETVRETTLTARAGVPMPMVSVPVGIVFGLLISRRKQLLRIR